ncbi:hypothetical protein MGMO_131c00020 [Methyloglobulus morosus KoM1]|uniref:Uncharacterized protein n=1 Tax=Methyloglobulus morosus KoM1 TaxID=1116472 RepID=V5B8K8_9GAMM|nr:hypothetical protein [Methyloglobulus morosus]ESS69560.1 hypothetical protein MGMO_131c00020 [Methyloglobulus morosus KoM1]
MVLEYRLRNKLTWPKACCIWGVLFIVPLLDSKLVRKGMILSLIPTVVQLFVVFPHAGNGTAGLELDIHPIVCAVCQLGMGCHYGNDHKIRQVNTPSTFMAISSPQWPAESVMSAMDLEI